MASHKGTSVDEPVRKVAWVHVMTASRSVQPDNTLEEIHQEPLESQCTKNLPEPDSLNVQPVKVDQEPLEFANVGGSGEECFNCVALEDKNRKLQNHVKKKV